MDESPEPDSGAAGPTPTASPTPEAPDRSTPAGSLWRHHDFRQLWMGDSVSVFGNQLVGS